MDISVTRTDAETWATWFRSLGDPSRILLLNLLATTGRSMSVGEIVDALDLGQSTVSHHLKLLLDVGFVLVEPDGNVRRYEINRRCLRGFPSAAELVMGRAPSGDPPWCIEPVPTPTRRGQR